MSELLLVPSNNDHEVCVGKVTEYIISYVKWALHMIGTELVSLWMM